MDQTPYVNVGIIFETARAQGRKMQWLADASGVSLSYLSKIQRGVRPARREWAQRAASALGLPPSLFLPAASSQLDDLSRVHDRRESEVA